VRFFLRETRRRRTKRTSFCRRARVILMETTEHRLPRQARDRRAENNSATSGWRFVLSFCAVPVCRDHRHRFRDPAHLSPPRLRVVRCREQRLAGEKTVFFSPTFYTKQAIILPRQARDNRRDSTQRKRDDAFSRSGCVQRAFECHVQARLGRRDKRAD
jgi:hypothetical protein